jgi:hypothetical protein
VRPLRLPIGSPTDRQLEVAHDEDSHLSSMPDSAASL